MGLCGPRGCAREPCRAQARLNGKEQHVATSQQINASQIAEAEYTVEFPATCPHCREGIDVVNVARLLRTRVNFTSTLPRRGNVVACPKYNTIIIISAALA
jgi:hypothetical protein